MKTSIRIFHTNDIHSNGAFLKKLHAYMTREKRPEDLYFDSGDIIDLQSPIVQADAGISETSLLVECGLDGIAVGNGETDLGHAELTALVKHFDCFMSANIGANDGTPVEDLPASRIYERGGIRILVIALSPYYNEHFRSSGYNVFTTMKNLRTVPPEEPFRRELERRKGQYDYCVLLSHSGHLIERELMKRLPGIDLCLGGHSHAVEHYPGYTQSGKGAFLGRITLEIEDGVIREVENLQIDLPEAEDEAFDALYREKAAFADRVLSEELPSLGALSFDPFRESPLINFICDALYDAFDVDLAIMHGGISEGDLTPPVSKKSLLETFPSKLNPAVFPVQGRSILEALRASLDETRIHESGRGPGFRGEVLGTLGVSKNVRVFTNPFYVTVDGKPLNPGKTYTIAADDYLQRGTGYHSLAVPNDKTHYHIWFIRDLAAHYLMNEEVYRSALNIRRRLESRALQEQRK